jgi:protein involved in polysaccharide export with SLBB domain
MIRTTLVTILLIAGCGAPLAAQSVAVDPTGVQMSRSELQQLLTRYEETVASSAYSGSMRNQAREEAEVIRQRLVDGDLRVGDQITLHVEGHAPLQGTFTVVSGRLLILPEIGEVPLTGVLRAELQPYLTSHLERFLVNPVVVARSLIRVEIIGAVGRPGFYMIPSDMLLSETLMQAGGPASAAALDRIRIERGKETIWKGDRLRQLMIEGTTLDQLNMRAGDTVNVPAAQGRFPAVTKVLGGVTTLASFVWLLRRTGVL